MTKTEFLGELQKRLKKLPYGEQAYALAYYEEYLTEAGPKGEAAAIAALGSPAQVASDIISEYAIKQVGQSATAEQKPENQPGGLKTLWIVILAVVASPIALPLALALVATVFSLLISAFAVILSLFVTALACMATGVVALGFAVVCLVMLQPFEAAVVLGFGLIFLSLGAALLIFSVWLARLTIKAVTRLFAKVLKRKGGQS